MSTQVSELDQVIARLKTLQSVEDAEDSKEGYQAGKEWAQETATPRELRRLRKAYDAAEGAENLIAACGGDVPAAIYQVLWPESDVLAEIAWWTNVLGKDYDDKMSERSFAAGFVAGAIDVWDKVKHHV